MSHSSSLHGNHGHSATNGASLEDCHANFFALTDVCGIKWSVFREPEAPICLDPAEDRVLQSYASCLEAEFLSVWRRVPKRALVTYTYDQMTGNQIPSTQEGGAGEAGRNPLVQRKELWVFWYGDKPAEQIKKLISAKLVKVDNLEGSWENGLTYEARTLLFKALNNLIERSLVKKDFARLGKWFVQPFDGPEKALNKSTHLSFSFDYFIHGESSVCASIDVRQHPPVRRLSLHHISAAKGQSAPTVPVILAPYGLAATLTGVTYKGASDASVTKLMKEWDHFYPLDRNRYFCQDGHGGLVEMPVAVEVMIAGVRMVYPTCYVLVTDIDCTANGYVGGAAATTAVGGGRGVKNQSTFRNSDDVADANHEIFHVEHSPFTASNHTMLGDGGIASYDLGGAQATHERSETVWHDSICYNPEAAASAAANNEQQPGGGNQIMEYLAHWDFCNPGKMTKKRSRLRSSSKEGKSRDRYRFNSKMPFHRKADIVDDLAWTLGQSDMMMVGGGNGSAGGNGAAANGGAAGCGGGVGGGRVGQMGPPGSVKGMASPASVGPATPFSAMTPKGPNSVKTPGGFEMMMSPHPPPSNGPLTPAADGVDLKPPRTPKSVPQYFGAASPFTNIRSVESNVRKIGSVKQEEGDATTPSQQESSSNGQQQQQQQQHSDVKQEPGTSSLGGSRVVGGRGDAGHLPGTPFKRPALPLKEYEEELKKEDVLSDNVYDHKVLHHWLNYPVKKFRPTESKKGDPFRPMYRRNSQANVFESSNEGGTATTAGNETVVAAAAAAVEEKLNNGIAAAVDIKEEPMEAVNGIDSGRKQPGGGANTESGQQGSNGSDPYEFSEDRKDGKKIEDKGDFYTLDGIKPSISDLDNLFDDSSDETDAAGHAPTPPDSNKPANSHEDGEDGVGGGGGSGGSGGKGGITKLKGSSGGNAKHDPIGNLPHDQLAQMFPTPPSHDSITSPAAADANAMDIDGHGHFGHHGHPTNVKSEQLLLLPSSADLMDWSSFDDASVWMANSIFSPLPRLFSDDFAPIILGPGIVYKPKPRSRQGANNLPSAVTNGNPSSTAATAPLASAGNNSSTNNSGPNSVPTPGHKLGLNSPMTPEGGPRSQHGPNSVGGYGAAGGINSNNPAAASPAPASASSNYLNKSLASTDPASNSKTPEASSLVLNLVLSDTLLNLFRDHNFDSCTMCVCNNEGNIRGRDASLYLSSTEFADDDDVSCSCGFSAVVNRRLAHQSGLFYEDETEVTSITEDLYYRKKASLLLLDPKGSDSEQNFNDRSSEVDSIPGPLLELIHQQSTFATSQQNAIVKYSRQYLRNTTQPPSLSMVELMDGNDVIFVALNQVKTASDPATSPVTKLDEAQKGTCLHKWSLLPAAGPNCSEDVIRVMKSLKPILNMSLHIKKSAKPTSTNKGLSVDGPLTWRQFHQMAGPATKGNTDDQVEPLPVPTITVGHERDFLSLSPLSLHFWESLSLEPYSQPRDVVYFVVAPDNEVLLNNAKTFFKNLSQEYELCRLGKHVPHPSLRDGFLRVGKNSASKLGDSETERWFDLIGDFPNAALLKLYSQVCRQWLTGMLSKPGVMDRCHLGGSSASKSVLGEKPPASPMQQQQQQSTGSMNTVFSQDMGDKRFGYDDAGKENFGGGGSSGTGLPESSIEEDEGDPPAVVIYMIDPFSIGVDNCDMLRLSSLGLLRCFSQILPHLPDNVRNNIHLQLISVESIFQLSQLQSPVRRPDTLRGLAFSVYTQAAKPMQYQKDCKTLTGFGPASGSERYMAANEAKTKLVRHLHQPTHVLAPPPAKKKASMEADTASAANERTSTVLFVNYCLSEDQHWLLASCCDDRGEMLNTVVINVEIPNKTRRKKASARRVGLRKLMNWILGVMSQSLVPWRLVIGRIGRIGHGELRGWSVLLGRKALKKASKQLREMCSWPSDVPAIMSACLISIEPDSSLRLMSDQFTPDERFGQTASNCQLSTPKDASCTHILVFPTSATAQSSQKAFEDHQEGLGASKDDLDDFGLPDMDLGDDIDNVNDDLGLGMDIFNEDFTMGDDRQGSPGSPGKGNSLSHPNSPSQQNRGGGSDVFKYGQEEPGERIEILQQPLALGYLVSTAKIGQMPRWFWSSCPHLENVCPVFLKSALHINQASVLHGGDDGYTPHSSSGRVHSLDSTYTTDVLRYVLEGYNALSWLSLDAVSHDRRSCMPLHVQILQQMYTNLSALV